MLLMKKGGELFLFAEYYLSAKIAEGYELLKLIRFDVRIKCHKYENGHTLIDYIAEQRRLLQQLEDEYKRKKKNRLAALAELKDAAEIYGGVKIA